MFAQCNSEGNQYLLLAGIIDHRKDNSAVEIKDFSIQQQRLNLQPRRTTKWWSLRVEWKDKSTSWEHLANLKESNPVGVADYLIVACGLETESAFFAWCMPFTHRHRNRIIAAVNKCYYKQTHEFCIEIPKTYKDCVCILDKGNGNKFGRMPYGRGWWRLWMHLKYWATANHPTNLSSNALSCGIWHLNGKLSVESSTSCRRTQDRSNLNDKNNCNSGL